MTPLRSECCGCIDSALAWYRSTCFPGFNRAAAVHPLQRRGGTARELVPSQATLLLFGKEERGRKIMAPVPNVLPLRMQGGDVDGINLAFFRCQTLL